MRSYAVAAATIVVFSGFAAPAVAAQNKPLPGARPLPVVERTVSGTVIQPTTTIIPDGHGHATYIVIPRRRSYLDTGTEVSVGDRSYQDYVLPPGGDPGRPNWFYGPDVQGKGSYPIGPFNIPGYNPNTPF
jgi:hypothetical protein